MSEQDPDVWRVAKLVMERHGDEASAHAAAKARDALASGERDDAVAWTRIYEAIESLRQGLPGPGDTVH
ncbi:hypothetical protein CU669_05295 [Paramagnetospirillum kuznetsovii]|uniref:Uncharacterized protein n=1 Tax=Paramagnetospirillum kuznetsovii TaxID=2053833 RepID=A0A364P0H6_9PROT|nr:hypothetical protein [Paramagnetospirillum kuznetsovii]RAU22806.1 hypothetical protein CU669_05295 [Paramagnetospirillum kuznetsovii]